jgi:DNA-binding transcriptional LysR family regulator
MLAMAAISAHDGPAMARNLDIALLRSFVAVADRASMTAASRALHLTQGAVSQQVKRLEKTFGAALFARERGGLRLTAPGERLLGQARRLLGLNDEIWAAMGGAIEGPVRLGAPYDLVGTCLAPALSAYAAAHPLIEVSLACTASPELLAMLAAGAIDVAVVEEEIGAAAGECLAVRRLVWAGARGGAAHRRPVLPVSMVAASCAFRPAVEAALAGCGRAWRTVFESGSLEATTATVRADLAVTAWLDFTVPADLDILPPEAGLPALPPFAITLHRPRDASPAAAALAAAIRDALAARIRA